ncbi:MAG: hypothetical protein M3295_05525, partial [Chloroflexota bacterium]|nr:hypothetical protein [Chloroflexota bacterium]
CHVSQVGQAGPFHDWDEAIRDRFLAEEHYRLVRSNLATDGREPTTALMTREADLWAGLSG